MLKTTVKIFLMFVMVVLVAVATGLITYNITKKLTAETPANASATQPAEHTSAPRRVDPPENVRTQDLSDKAPEHYTVRLEGTTLGVYVSYDGKEEFLYHENVYKSNLSAQDIQLLQNGVEFLNISDLTGFIENFTS